VLTKVVLGPIDGRSFGARFGRLWAFTPRKTKSALPAFSRSSTISGFATNFRTASLAIRQFLRTIFVAPSPAALFAGRNAFFHRKASLCGGALGACGRKIHCGCPCEHQHDSHDCGNPMHGNPPVMEIWETSQRSALSCWPERSGFTLPSSGEWSGLKSSS